MRPTTKARRALLSVLLIFCAPGCDEYQRLSGAEFQKQYDLQNQQTMAQAEYLGIREGKAYLGIRTMSTIGRTDWEDRVVYAPLEDLEPSFRRELEAMGRAFSGGRR